MADLNYLSKFTLSASALSGLIVVTPDSVGYQPQPRDEEQVPPPNFLFTYEGQNSVLLSSEITDHYVEDNTAIQDQVTLNPAIIRVRGYIGELAGQLQNLPRFLKVFNRKLEQVGPYLPRLSSRATELFNEAAQAYEAVQITRNNLVAGFQRSPVENKQQKAFNFFEGYRAKRRLFRVQTPWKVFKNMLIRSIETIQDDDEPGISSFDLEFKEIKFVGDAFSPGDRINAQGRLKLQSEGQVEFGQVTPSQDTSTDLVMERIGAFN